MEVSRKGIIPIFDTLINPKRDIPPTVSAVHHITKKDVEGKPTFEKVWSTIIKYLEGAVIVAHNAQFDRSMIPETNCPWICSYRLACHYGPMHLGIAIKYLVRYWMELEIDAKAAHSAAGDTLVTAHVFHRELSFYRRHVAKTHQVEDLIKYAASPIPIEIMPFGRHKGVPLADVPQSYVDWTLQNMTELDPDLKTSLEQVATGRVDAD